MSFPWHDYSVIVITLTTIGMKVLQVCVFLVVRVVVCGARMWGRGRGAWWSLGKFYCGITAGIAAGLLCGADVMSARAGDFGGPC